MSWQIINLLSRTLQDQSLSCTKEEIQQYCLPLCKRTSGSRHTGSIILQNREQPGRCIDQDTTRAYQEETGGNDFVLDKIGKRSHESGHIPVSQMQIVEGCATSMKGLS